MLITEGLLRPFPFASSPSLSVLESDIEIVVGMNKGTHSNVSGLLWLPGHPMSGLVMTKMSTLGEEFLDSEDEVVPASMIIVRLGE